MNSITSPEQIAQIHPQNRELLSDFLDYLRSLNRSETTIAAYKNDIEIAFVWCLQFNHNKPFVDWTKRNIVAYQNWLLSTNENSPARIRRLKAALSSMSNFIEAVCDDSYPHFRNIIHKIESPANQPVRKKTIYTEEEVEALLAKLTEKERYDQACVIALAAYSGRRKSELTRFKVSDFDDSRLVCGGALYQSAPLKTKGANGGKYIPCYTLAKAFKPYFDLWMQYRNNHGIASEWLFPKRSDPREHITVGTLNSWTTSFTQMTGKDFYFHSLRHTRTTSFSRSGLPDAVIQTIMGWESADMCRIYNDMSAEEEIGMWFRDGEIIHRENDALLKESPQEFLDNI